MSTVITDNLTGKTSAGDVTITSEGGSATMQLQQGLAKAWANFDTDAVINESFNGSSITDNATGQFKLTIVSAMSSTTYAQTVGSGTTKHIQCWEGVRTASVAGFLQFNNSHNYADFNDMNLKIHGDLA